MRLVRFSTSLILFLIFFVWSFFGNYSQFVDFYFPAFLIFFLILLVPFSTPGFSERFFKFAGILEKHSFFIIPFFSFIFALFVSLYIFKGLPHVQDEINFKYLAETILDGKLSSPLHPHYEFFRFLYVIPSESGTYSIYNIGFSLILAPFLFFKIPFLLNPLLVAGSIFLLGKTVEELYDRRTASFSMFLASTSLFLVSMGGTWMSHPFCAFCTLGSVLFSVKSLKRNFYLNTAMSSVFISLLIFARPQNALFILIPVLIFTGTSLKRTMFLKGSVLSGLIIAVFLVPFFYSNYVFTGKLISSKHSEHWNISEPQDDCMNLGLGNGCRHATIIELPEKGLTVKHAAYITYIRLVQLVYGLFFHPLILIFLSILFLFRTDKETNRKDFFMLLCFMITFCSYFFFYFDGNVYGPRYYYEASFFLIPLTARGIFVFFDKIKVSSKNPLFNPLNLFTSFFLAGLVFQYTVSAPAFFKPHKLAFWGTDPLLYTALKEKNIENGVVFVFPEQYYSSGLATMNMHKIDDNKIIFALDLGPESNRRLMNYYNGKRFYRAFFNKQWFDKKLPEIIEINKDDFPDIIKIELEQKLYPLSGAPDYCNIYPAWRYIDNYSGFALPKELTDFRKYFFCKFTDNSESYSFGQYFEKNGLYKVKILSAKTPVGAKFLFSSDDQEITIDFFNDENKVEITEFSMNFEKGFNMMYLKPLNIKENGAGYFIIDNIEFEKIAE